MTLDEAIRHADEIAEENEKKASLYRNDAFGFYAETKAKCEECAKEHRQLASWLRELKGYRSEEAYRADMSMQEWLDRRGDLNE